MSDTVRVLNSAADLLPSYSYGYVTYYQINDEKKYKVKLKYSKCSGNTGCEIVSEDVVMFGIPNTFGLKSINDVNQMIIMSDDDKFIFFYTDSAFTIYSFYILTYAIIKYGCKIPLASNYFYLSKTAYEVGKVPDEDKQKDSLKFTFRLTYLAKNPTNKMLEYNNDTEMWTDLYYIYKEMQNRISNDMFGIPESFCLDMNVVNPSDMTKLYDCKFRPNAKQKLNIIYSKEDDEDPRVIAVKGGAGLNTAFESNKSAIFIGAGVCVFLIICGISVVGIFLMSKKRR